MLKAAKIPKITRTGGSFKKIMINGRKSAAVREPRATVRVKKVIKTHTAIVHNTTRGTIARKTPNVVATPFPPLNFKKSVQLCPEITESPRRIW